MNKMIKDKVIFCKTCGIYHRKSYTCRPKEDKVVVQDLVIDEVEVIDDVMVEEVAEVKEESVDIIVKVKKPRQKKAPIIEEVVTETEDPKDIADPQE